MSVVIGQLSLIVRQLTTDDWQLTISNVRRPPAMALLAVVKNHLCRGTTPGYDRRLREGSPSRSIRLNLA